MASELSWRHTATGKTMYATIRSAARTYWHTDGTPGLETLTVAHWANYAIALTETPGSSYFYTGSWPAALTTAGFYWLDVYEEPAGAGAAISDSIVGLMLGYWNGTAFLPADGTVGGSSKPAVTLAAADLNGGLGVSLTAAERQALDKKIWNCSGTVYHVATAAAGGSDANDGFTWATAFLTVPHAIGVSASGDKIIIGAGTFALGNNTISCPDGVEVIGSDIDVTIITSTYQGPLAVFRPGTGGGGGFTVSGV